MVRGVGTPGARPLLAAKLIVPSARPGAVPRPRLHEHLDGGAGHRLTVVVAPAGWGKTTLLSAWAADPARAGRVAWLSIDEADDEPVRFWTYLLSALERVAPELTADALSALRAPGSGPDQHRRRGPAERGDGQLPTRTSWFSTTTTCSGTRPSRRAWSSC